MDQLQKADAEDERRSLERFGLLMRIVVADRAQSSTFSRSVISNFYHRLFGKMYLPDAVQNELKHPAVPSLFVVGVQTSALGRGRSNGGDRR